MSPRIGVCSWSLMPSDGLDLIEKLKSTSIQAIQLALDPLRTGAWDPVQTQDELNRAGVRVLSGMVATAGEDYTSLESIRTTGGLRPDETWEENRQGAIKNARLAKTLGLGLISFHAGFLPEDSAHPERPKLLARLGEFVDIFKEQGIACALETGQESAEALRQFLVELDHPTLGINFDPANMILYGKGDPVQALDLLHPFVRQIHIKDAIATKTPGTWGEEVPAGSGDVDWQAFFDVLSKRELKVDLVVEREAGDQRIADIRTAQAMIYRQLKQRSLA